VAVEELFVLIQAGVLIGQRGLAQHRQQEVDRTRCKNTSAGTIVFGGGHPFLSGGGLSQRVGPESSLLDLLNSKSERETARQTYADVLSG